MYSPSTYPILTAHTGPSNGIPAIISAADDPMIDSSPGEISLSRDKGDIVMTVSLIIPFGNIGLSGLSVSLQYNTASSEGLHSLLLNLPPQIFPAAYHDSRKSIARGMKSLLGSGSFSIIAVTKRLVPHILIVTAPSE